MRYIQCDICEKQIEDEADVIEVLYADTRLDICSGECLVRLGWVISGGKAAATISVPEPEPERVTPPVSDNHFRPVDEDQIEQVTGVVRRGRATRE